jgi:putative SOS response-associated peptidase YedK
MIMVPVNINKSRYIPAILREKDHKVWLHGTAPEARAVLRPYPPDLMVAASA